MPTQVLIQSQNNVIGTLNINSTNSYSNSKNYLQLNLNTGLNVLKITCISGSFQLNDILISSTIPLAIITSAKKISYIQSHQLSFQITAINNPVAFNANNLPAGLIVNTISGTISGTAKNNGNFTIDIATINSGGQFNDTLTIIILPSLLLEESFNYPIGSGLYNMSGGYGFSQPWIFSSANLNLFYIGKNFLATSSTNNNMLVQGGGGYLVAGRAIDVINSFSYFIDPNDSQQIGSGGKSLWIGFILVKNFLNNQDIWVSFHQQSSVVWSSGNNRISVGYFGTQSNNPTNQSQQYWSFKYGDNLTMQTNKSIVINEMTFFVLKIDLNAGNNTDTVSLYVNPKLNTTVTPSADLVLNNISIMFRSVGYYASSSVNQSCLGELRIGVNYQDVWPRDTLILKNLMYLFPKLLVHYLI